MSRTSEAVSSQELSTCPRCARLFHPPDPEGCWSCQRVRRKHPRVVEPEKSIDQLEREEEAEAATHYFLESFWGHPGDAD